jgi:hypothetical protein
MIHEIRRIPPYCERASRDWLASRNASGSKWFISVCTISVFAGLAQL